MIDPAPTPGPRGSSILYVIGSLDVGGTERHLLGVLPRLAARGLRVSVFTLGRPGRLAGAFRAAGVEVRCPPGSSNLDGAPRLARRSLRAPLAAAALCRALRSPRPDLVHFFLPEAYLIGTLCSMLLGVSPRVMSRRSSNRYQRKHPILARLERHLHRRTTLVLGNCAAVIAELADEGLPRDRLGLIYNGVDLAAFDVEAASGVVRADLGLDESVWVMVIVANLIPYKGHRDLLRALVRVKDRLPAKWCLLCVGRDDGIGPELRALGAELGVGEHVQFLGERADVPRLLRLADAAVLCSHEEGFSNAVLEAMAAGLPVVATAVGGSPEAVDDGETGLLVPPHDPDALGAALVTLAEDRDLAARLGRAARSRVAEQFTLSATTEAYAAVYTRLLSC